MIMGYKKKGFTIIGFEPLDEYDGFNSLGSMDKLDSQLSVYTTMNLNKTLIYMLTHEVFKHITPSIWDDRGCFVNENNLFIVNITIDTHASKPSELNNYRELYQKTFKSWAEKSRVKNLRGWRLHAIKDLTIETHPDTKIVQIKSQIILSSLIIYSKDLDGIIFSKIMTKLELEKDILLLNKQLKKVEKEQGFPFASTIVTYS